MYWAPMYSPTNISMAIVIRSGRRQRITSSLCNGGSDLYSRGSFSFSLASRSHHSLNLLEDETRSSPSLVKPSRSLSACTVYHEESLSHSSSNGFSFFVSRGHRNRS